MLKNECETLPNLAWLRLVMSCSLRYSEVALTTLTSAPRNPGPRLNKKMSSYQYRKSHRWDTTVVRSSYLHNGISYTGKIAYLYCINPQTPMCWCVRCHMFHMVVIFEIPVSYFIYWTVIITGNIQPILNGNKFSTRSYPVIYEHCIISYSTSLCSSVGI